MTPIQKLRRVNRRRLTSGFFDRQFDGDEQRQEDDRDDAKATMKGEPNQSSLLPSSSTVCSAERPTAMVTMPASRLA